MNGAASKEDYRMRYVLAFGIIFVVLGHIGGTYAGVFTISGLLPFYSFHLPLFLFVSGYFYKAKSEEHVFRYLLKKAKTLLIPFFVCSLIFLLFQTLLHQIGFTLGHTFSFYNWLVWPWVHLQPFTFSIPSWYLIAFFICCVIHVAVRKFFTLFLKNPLARELVILILYLVLGMLSVFVNKRFVVGETATVYLRSVVMLFFIQLGFFYREYLESYDTMKNIPYFSIILGLRMIMIILFVYKGKYLSFALYGLLGFEGLGLPFYVSGIMGIAFWIRICKLLADHFKPIGLFVSIGKNTKYIMLFHVFGFFVLNSLFYLITKIKPIISFDIALFKSDMYYTATDITQIALVYLVFGIGVSLIITIIIQRVGKVFRRPGKEKLK